MLIDEIMSGGIQEERRTKEKKTLLHFIPDSLMDLMGSERISFKGRSLKTVYLSDIIHTMLLKYHFDEVNSFTLSSLVLKDRYGQDYNHLIDYLILGGYIRMTKNYSAGKRSRTYTLTDKVLGSALRRRQTEDRVLLRKYAKRYYQGGVEMDTPIRVDIRKTLVSDLERVSVNMEDALDIIEEIPDRLSLDRNLYAVHAIDSGHLFYHFDHYGRMHTNFTILKSEVRKTCLLMDGAPVSECDVPNSQPLFLYLMIKKSKTKWVDEEELRFLGDLLSGGDFYDYFARFAFLSRKEAKELIYKVLFGRNRWNSRADILFKEHFPTVHRYIMLYKKENGDYRTLAYRLQREESLFIFGEVLPDIYQRCPGVPVVTVHDSIVFPSYVEEEVKEIFTGHLKKLYMN